MNIFDGKFFNAEVFGGYVDTIPNAHMNALVQSGALRMRADLKAMLVDPASGKGSNIYTSAMLGRLAGDDQNYDGKTDIVPTANTAYKQTRIVFGRAKAWEEKDFTVDITGRNFYNDMAGQVSDYWMEKRQNALISILKGVFSMADDNGKVFVTAHTSDITAVTNSEGDAGMMDATSINTALQKACGDNKGKFSIACMHSAVATNLENLKILTYAKYNNAQGLEVQTAIGYVNGKLILIDDDMPVETVDTKTVYTTYLLGAGSLEYTDCGAFIPVESHRDPFKYGGETFLITRLRNCFAPYGLSFKGTPSSDSPTNAELAAGTSWELVKDAAGTPIAHKLIPIAQIKSLG
jgi:hypothetical protein